MAGGDFELAKELAAELGIEIPDEERPHLTDTGNARWLAILHGDTLRYCPEYKEFYCWHDTHWAEDTGNLKTEAWTKDVPRNYYKMAAALNTKVAGLNTKASIAPEVNEIDSLADEAGKLGDIAQKYTAWAKRCEASEKRASMVRWVKSEDGIKVQPSGLDRDPWLLNCLNGTIDLRTGERLDHRREDLITRVCPVKYAPTATYSLWDEMLKKIQPNEEIRRFIRRAMGYTITGLNTEDKLFFAYGGTSTGKSTFLQAIQNTLGNYSRTTPFNTFLEKTHSSQSEHSSDVASLNGARMVVSIEVDEGKRLAESLIKQIAGGDVITARHMYAKSFSFRATCKLWWAANYRPRVRADDAAMWRRILLIPFEVTIPEAERDPSVRETLRDLDVAGPAIMAWLVQGCLEWQQEGLNPPPQVIQATEGYREEMDPLSDFLSEKCVQMPDAKANNTDIYETYRKWCSEAGIRHAITQMAFTKGLKARGFEQHSNGKAKFWPGLGIIADDRLIG